jgi:hypothetical protein
MTNMPISCMRKLAFLLSIFIILGSVTTSFAQHHDPAPPAKLGNRIAVMDFIFPEKIGTKQDFTLSMILYDQVTNTKFSHLSIQLAIFKEGNEKTLMNLLFYDKNGEIIIDFKHQSFDKPRVIVQAPQETYLGGFMGEYGSHIKVLQNIFSEDGLYRLEATVVSIDNPKKFIEPQITFTKEIHIGEHSASMDKISIPDWIKNSAGWWSSGKITDDDFASGIQFMIKERIIQIPVEESSSKNIQVEIPSWVKNTAKWWSEGSIGDKDFAAGIQYLVKVGVIQI